MERQREEAVARLRAKSNDKSKYRGMYVKDWHVDHTPLAGIWEVPVIFRDDWLNWYWQRIRPLAVTGNGTDNDTATDDYSFCYVGARNSRTDCHHDVCLSYSWSINMQGCKRWRLWPPEEAAALFRQQQHAGVNTTNGSTSGTAAAAVRVRSPLSALTFGKELDSTCWHLHMHFPHLDADTLVQDPRPGCYSIEDYPLLPSSKYLTVLQREGEAMFVPSGWYHCVENVTEGGHDDSTASTTAVAATSASSLGLTISVNRNWFNGFNLVSIVLFVLGEYCAVQWELRHLLTKKEAAREHTYKGEVLFRQKSQRGLVGDTANGDDDDDDYDDDIVEEMYMDAYSWHNHCDVLLRANAAISLKMLMEILASRLALWQSLYPVDSSASESGTLDRTWVGMFCPHFYGDAAQALGKGVGYEVQEADKDLAVLQHSVHVPLSLSVLPVRVGTQEEKAEVDDGKREEGGDSVWVLQCGRLADAVGVLLSTPGVCRSLHYLVSPAPVSVPVSLWGEREAREELGPNCGEEQVRAAMENMRSQATAMALC